MKLLIALIALLPSFAVASLAPRQDYTTDVSKQIQNRDLTFVQASSQDLGWTFYSSGTTPKDLTGASAVVFQYSATTRAWRVPVTGAVVSATGGTVLVSFTPSQLNTNSGSGSFDYLLTVSSTTQTLAMVKGRLTIAENIAQSGAGPLPASTNSLDWSLYPTMLNTGTYGPYIARSNLTATADGTGRIILDAAITGGGGSGDMLKSTYDPANTNQQLIGINDSRLTDARTPIAHNQDWSTITGTPSFVTASITGGVTLASVLANGRNAGTNWIDGLQSINFSDNSDIESLNGLLIHDPLKALAFEATATTRRLYGTSLVSHVINFPDGYFHLADIQDAGTAAASNATAFAPYFAGTALTNGGTVYAHTTNQANPHGTTAAQVGAAALTGATFTGDIILPANGAIGNNTNYSSHILFSAISRVKYGPATIYYWDTSAVYGNFAGATNIPATGINGTAVTNSQLAAASNALSAAAGAITTNLASVSNQFVAALASTTNTPSAISSAATITLAESAGWDQYVNITNPAVTLNAPTGLSQAQDHIIRLHFFCGTNSLTLGTNTFFIGTNTVLGAGGAAFAARISTTRTNDMLFLQSYGEGYMRAWGLNF